MAQGSGGFKTETPVMQNAFSQVIDISANIQGQLTQIESTLEMMSQGWGGSAFNTFSASLAQILGDCANIQQLISWIGTTGISNMKNYVSAETASQAAASLGKV